MRSRAACRYSNLVLSTVLTYQVSESLRDGLFEFDMVQFVLLAYLFSYSAFPNSRRP